MGLACKYQKDGVHKKDLPDPKKSHNGTPEFTSRDAHKGCKFNFLFLTGGLLPVPTYCHLLTADICFILCYYQFVSLNNVS